ncbi:Rieske (2Fe-2S) protein [Sulfurisoma sediminicola]|uniref:Nitrite reductase/ring-hydroxylating ferredoxin subunit n=1 Tax=Sulfurisoma sediminicola TaxID=1381557 RepID=A0A497XEJ5_9PROT|nr:Rieske 2Fe-2S domain-containing protein [Sulfurisoma sediminicola]RLJ64955.1 nitrite reductase/ring-hydroxylating ferredoxin subunit [Sulfurisoma sediminicola]
MARRERLICASDDLVDGGPGIRCEVAGDAAEAPVAAFAVRFRGRVHAYLNRCGHIPVELDWQHGQFFESGGLYLICATHGALYDPETGHCVGGRCNGRGLVPLEVSERGGSVYLLEG